MENRNYTAVTYSSGFTVDPDAYKGTLMLPIKHLPKVMEIIGCFYGEIGTTWPWYARAFAWLFRKRIDAAISGAARYPFMEAS